MAPRLVAVNHGTLTLANTPTSVTLDAVDTTSDLTIARAAYLHIERILGTGAPPIIDVSLEPASAESARNKSPLHTSELTPIGALGLYGLEDVDAVGMHLVLDVSHYLPKISKHIQQQKQIRLLLQPRWEMSEEAAVSIGRVALYVE